MKQTKFMRQLFAATAAATLLVQVAPAATFIQPANAPVVALAQEETQVFTDDLGRDITLPAHVETILASGPNSQVVLYSIAPDKMVGWNSSPKPDALKYLPQEMADMPEVGSVFGKKELSKEEIINLNPDVIVDIGDKKDDIAETLDTLQDQTDVPVIFLDGNLDDLPTLYTRLGELLEKDVQNQVNYIEKLLTMANDNHEKAKEKDIKFYYAFGEDGTRTGAEGDFRTEVLEKVGLVNVFTKDQKDTVNSKEVSPEQIVEWQPEVVFFTDQEPFDQRAEAPWSETPAAETNQFYLIPNEPFNWVSGPKSINALMGIPWLGHVFFNDLYNVDLIEEMKTFYQTFYHHELSDEQAQELLTHALSSEQ
ncbi:ABC transporter substrate-binding protein [Dolosicoccus paucivorans]